MIVYITKSAGKKYVNYIIKNKYIYSMDEETARNFKATQDTVNKILNLVKQDDKSIKELNDKIDLNCTKLDQLKEIGLKNQSSINELTKMVRGLP